MRPRRPRPGGGKGSSTTTSTPTYSLRIDGLIRHFQNSIPQRRMGEANHDGHVLPLGQRRRPNRIPPHPLDDRHAPPALHLRPRIERPDKGNRHRDGTPRRRGTRPGVRMRSPRVRRVDRSARPALAGVSRRGIRRALDVRAVLSGRGGERAGERVAGVGSSVVVVVSRGRRSERRRGGILREADGPVRQGRLGGRLFGECDYRRDYSDGKVFEKYICSNPRE
mmetsp:Transcript_11663/g.22075  ORF Transcript_11663/g.22075 Transcript_11663/m.22075 type:complete len:223 (+) Transcript_11663:1720-2388(+)